nr:glycosyltransferase family 61 protein [uncultured Devosia sp.]
MAIYQVVESQIARLLHRSPDFWSRAVEIWTVSAGDEQRFPAAIFLPGQLDRIENTVFGDLNDTITALTKDEAQSISPTIAARFRDVLLSDGVLYKDSASYHLARRSRRIPPLGRPPRMETGAIYDSWVGVRYFGNWLMDDCETYRLAEATGKPVTIHAGAPGHRQEYEKRLAIAPIRTSFAHFDELILFQDLANNSGKKARAADRRRRLLDSIPPASPHPGVFLMRGQTGDPRLLVNEQRLAEDLAARYGIQIVHIMEHSVESLVRACAGARLLIGVEGSQLVHALAVMPPGGTMLVLMPPDRVTAAMKLMTDRLDLNFAMVIGSGTTGGFEINPNEIDATLDLLP